MGGPPFTLPGAPTIYLDGQSTAALFARFGRDPLAWAKLAEHERERGDILAAASILITLRRLFPAKAYGWRELAVLRARAGDAEGATRDFEHALATDPNSILTLTQFVRQLAGSGQLDEAEALLAVFSPTGPVETETSMVLSQLVSFMRAHPTQEVQACLSDLMSDGRYQDATSVEGAIASALANGAPFSLIRLGDGEGAWISEPTETDGRYHALYRANRRRALQIWFGDDDLLDRPDFLDMRSRLLGAIRRATILGIPYPARIEHEAGLASPDGYPSCVNVLRHVTAQAGAKPALCTHDIHHDLQLSGGLHRLVSGAARVGLISCHPGLAAELARRGHPVAAHILVPEEKGSAALLGHTGLVTPHYPVAYARTLRRIEERDWTATLWLVAAGLLGKLYCDGIAGRGGVALDIGSVADGWSGKATRPGMASAFADYRLWDIPEHIAK